ncbi:MAG: baseplate J/gp47 family protein, partial [Treponema sp.]|nr:baseplate J/gp47 family protein [Treponema sp.]
TVRIFERLYSDLSGFAISPAIVEGGEEGFNYPLPPPEAGIYSINHSLQTGNSGIIQLIVISWNDSSGEETFRQARDTAIAAGQFVTIVMDNAPPRMSDLGAELNGRLNNKGIYDFARNSSFFLTLNRLHLLSDNGTDGGIHFSEAFNKPWTMDDRSHLRWRVSVTDTADPPFTAIAPSEWQPVTNNIFPTSSGGQSLSGLDENKVYDVWVELRDRMENISRTKATSLEIVAGTPVAVTGLEAECVPSGNQIKASWTTPANDASMIGAQVYVNGRLEATVTGTSGSYPFNVTPIVTTGVSTGQSVTGVTRYDIEVIAFNAAGDAAAEKLTIWNIPEMNVSQSNPAIELTQTDFSSKLSADARTYVLTQNITLATDWIPVGTGSGTDAFRGKFYGNGYTIKVDGDPPKNRGIVGIFGFVENAEIRDLRVEYNSIEAGASNYFGGIAGYARYATVIRNIIVDGSVTSVDGSFNSSSLSVGMIVGDMQAGVEIDNCYAALNLSLNADVSGTYTGGGIAGESSGIIRNSVVSGILKMASASSGNHIIGGIVGNMTGGSIESCNSSAAINIPNTHSASGLTIVGGVAGRIDADESITVSNTVANGDITVASKGTGEIVMGGVCGISMEATAANKISFENCEYSGKVISFNRDKTGPGDFVTIGGFIGDVGNHTGFTNCRSLSLIKVDTKTEINTSTNLEQLKIGGFAGLLKSGIKECYSTTSIEVTIKSTDNIVGTTIPETTRHSFGGFVGTMENLSTANQCYATGSITVTSYENESYRYFAGGFVGVIFTNVTVKNCYATGHIMVDRIDPSAKGLIDVGGFGGSMRHPTEAGTHHGTDSKIKYCFSVGSFTAKSCGSDGSAGGLVSYIYQQSTIKSCVVLGEYVSTQGSGNNIGRISGYPQINSTWENNYAADRLLLYKTAYDVIDSQPTALSPSGTTTNQNGGTINWGMIDSSFYRDKLGFSEEIWDLGTPVTRNKWPTLRGVGGQ